MRGMRRGKQQLSYAETRMILENGQTGFLAMEGTDGYPYVVPMNYVMVDDAIYVHCATEGHKVDAIKANPRVSFCVVARDKVLPEEFATEYQSVIVFGRASMVEDVDQKYRAIRALGQKYGPDDDVRLQREIDADFSRLAMIRIDVDHVTGKESLGLMLARKQS